MARVVQRQSSPPYLLIAFVVLFLVSTATAVLFWVQADNYKSNYTKLELNWKRIASPQEAGSPTPQIQELLSNYEKNKQSVLAQLNNQVEELTASITGTRTTFADAKAKTDRLVAEVESTAGRGLVTEARDLWQQLAASKADANNLRSQLDEQQNKVTQLGAAMEKLTKDTTAQIDALNADKRALEDKIQAHHQAYLDEQARIKAEMDNRINELNKEIAAKNEQLGTFEMNAATADQTIQALREELDRKRGPLSGGALSARKPDGKIMQVMDREKICYINIGKKDRVMAGLTFSVYPPTGIPDNGEGKGKLVVTNVMDSVSECRIVDQLGDNPVITGDLVANLAFDPRRVYTFVVEGDFDLHNKGEGSLEDTKEVKVLIKRFGGQVSDVVDVKTDFVVLGGEPKPVPKPSESAAETSWAAYHAQMQEFNRYQEIQKAAKEMGVPILNTNRFLALMGYAASTSAAGNGGTATK